MAKPTLRILWNLAVANPDEIQIGDFDEEPPNSAPTAPEAPSEDKTANPDEIVLEDEMDDVVAPSAQQTTQFLALDKCVRGRQFLEVVDIPSADVADGPRLSFDPEWLSITRAFHAYLSLDRMQRRLPEEAEAKSAVKAELEWVRTNVGDKIIEEVQNFCQTAPGPGDEGRHKFHQRERFIL